MNICLKLLLFVSFSAQSGSQTSPLLPPDDPVGNTSNPDKILLGKALYWDEQLSSTKTVACGTCHILISGGTDPRATITNPLALNPGFDEVFNTFDDIIGSPGVPESNSLGQYLYNDVYGFQDQVTNRSAPSVINSGYAFNLFWDGRAGDVLSEQFRSDVILSEAAALEVQILAPPTNSVEMAHNERNWSNVVETIKMSSPLALSPNVSEEMSNWIGNQSYFQLFDNAFGSSEISSVKIAMAIASYERSLFSNQSPFDAFNNGDTNAMTIQEKAGLSMFRTQGCDTCHSDAIFSNHEFHNTGVTDDAVDTGRFIVTGLNSDVGRFKTPSLRNLLTRNSFMHNGRFSTLTEVVEFYNRGGDFSSPNLDTRILPLFLSEIQKSSLVAFLGHGLTDQRVVDGTPPFTSPTLYTQSNRVPLISGIGASGTDGKIPVLTAIEPPLLGNKSFTVAIENALANSTSVLVIDSQDPGKLSLPDEADVMIFQSINLSIASNGDGYASLSVALASEQAKNGTTLFGRWYVEDIQASNGYAISQLLQFTLFKPTFGQAGLVFSNSFE